MGPSTRVRRVIWDGDECVGEGIFAINAMNGKRVQCNEFDTENTLKEVEEGDSTRMSF
jgi:hypothetical protein